jgi:hypothetical protein
MPSAYTPLLGLVLPVTGELDGQWGNDVNAQLTENLEASIAGFSAKSFSASPGNVWTLTTTGSGDPNEARSAILLCTGAPGETCYINAPKSSKTYVVVNNFTDNSSVYLRGGPTSPTTGAEIEADGSALVAWDNTVAPSGDFVKVAGGGGGASGAGGNQIFFLNDLTITADYTIPPGKNAGTFGPVSIDTDITVTVPTGQVWSIV